MNRRKSKKRKALLFLTFCFLLAMTFSTYAAEVFLCNTCGSVTEERQQGAGQTAVIVYYCKTCKKNVEVTPQNESDTGGDGTEEDAVDGNKDMIATWIAVIFGSSFIDDEESILNPVALLENSMEYVTEAYSDLTSTDFYTVFTGLGLLMVMFWFFVDLNLEKISQTEKLTLEQTLRLVWKPIVLIIFILGAKYIVEFFLSISWLTYNRVSGELSGTFGKGAENLEEITESIFKTAGYNTEADGIMDMVKNIPGMLVLVVSFIIPFLISLVSQFGIFYVVFSRNVKLVLMSVFCVIALGDLPNGGTKSQAMDYVRHFAGICFQSVVILVTLYVANLLVQGLVEHIIEQLGDVTGFGSIGKLSSLGVQMAVTKLVQLGCIMQSVEISKRIFGASGA